MLSRHTKIGNDLNYLESRGIIRDWYSQSQMPGRRWTFTPSGFSERSLTTSGIEDFILGVKATINAGYAKETS